MSKIDEQAPEAPHVNGAAADGAGGCPVAHNKALAIGCPVTSALRASSLARSSSTSGSMAGRRVSFQADELMAGERPNRLADSPGYKASNAVSMKKIVDELYRRVLGDERLSPFYEHINMVRLKNQQEKVMMMIFGGKDLMEQEEAPTLDLRVLHLKAIATQGLSTNHWQWFVDHLQVTLDSMPEIPLEARTSAMSWIKTTQDMFKPLTEEEKEKWNLAHPDAPSP